MSIPKAFHQFPLLPKELQIQILNYAIYSIPARSIIIIPLSTSPDDFPIITSSSPPATINKTFHPPIAHYFPGAPPATATIISALSHKLKIQPPDTQTSLITLLSLNHLSRTLTLRCYNSAFVGFFGGRYVYVRRGDRIAVRGYKADRRGFFARGFLGVNERKEPNGGYVGAGIVRRDAGEEGEKKFRVEARRNGVVYWNVCWSGDSGV